MPTILNWLFPSRERRKEHYSKRASEARKLRMSAESIATEAEALYHEQKAVSDELREERRRNHFSELFFYGIEVHDDQCLNHDQ